MRQVQEQVRLAQPEHLMEDQCSRGLAKLATPAEKKSNKEVTALQEPVQITPISIV